MPGVRRHAIWAAGTATLAGAAKRGAAIFVSSLTIHDFSFCPGSRFRIWRRTFSAAWQDYFPRLATDVLPPGLFRGNVHRSRAFSRNLLPRGELETARAH